MNAKDKLHDCACCAATLSQFLDLTPQRIDSLRKEGVLHSGRGGIFDLHKSFQAVIVRLRDRSSVTHTKQETAKMEQELLRIRIDEAAGKVLNRAEVEAAWADLILICRQKLLSLGNRIAPRLAFAKSESDMQREIDGEIDLILGELSRFRGTEEDERRVETTRKGSE